MKPRIELSRMEKDNLLPPIMKHATLPIYICILDHNRRLFGYFLDSDNKKYYIRCTLEFNKNGEFFKYSKLRKTIYLKDFKKVLTP